ncbi:hypothetical protein CLOHYLEM_06887 [[Clostridium] hylemonae DSM 15053]|uniref:Uncharacterized protein n=1 Tax=[Clostridium] hylemonae DSM 15053 TaxID=553973 RepID=C0C472_9FIRM|nr:hypothetical protein CLOHYLEM_06887 [[Clostridium] hylemonae DSM 15053]
MYRAAARRSEPDAEAVTKEAPESGTRMLSQITSEKTSEERNLFKISFRIGLIA